MAQPQRHAQPHRLREGDAQDHQGHADGGRRQAAPRAGGRHRRAALRRAHGPRARQPQQRVTRQGRRLAAAGRHRQGPGAPADRHDRRARAVRRLQLQHRPPRPRAMPSGWLREGKTVKILCVGRKGYDPAARLRAGRSSTASTSRASSSVGFANARRHRRTRCWRCSRPASSTSRTLYFSEFKSVIAQKPTALQLIPAKLPETARRRGAAGAAPSTSTSPTRTRSSSYLLPRNIATQIFRGLLENAASEQGARMSAMDNATRNAGDMINKLTIKLQPPAPGQHHQRADRDHLGRRSALECRL